nr:ATPase [Fimbriiglobus sp.]
LSLARTERPDTSAFTDPEIVQRIDLKNHIGFVLASDSPDRVQMLLNDYIARIARDHQAVLPAADKVSH